MAPHARAIEKRPLWRWWIANVPVYDRLSRPHAYFSRWSAHTARASHWLDWLGVDEMKGGPVRVGIVGSQFQAECHAATIAMIDSDMTVVAVASPTPGNAQKLAGRFKIPKVYTDYRELAADGDIEARS